MKKAIQLLALGSIAVGLFGCASPKMNMSVPMDKQITAPSNKALVYFVRPNAMGYAVHAAVYDGDTFIGFVPYNQKLPYYANPGKSRFMVISEAADFLDADLVAGKTYYAEVVPRMGAWRARFSLDPVTREELQDPKVQKQISKARLIGNNQKAMTWAAENQPSVMKKKNKYLPKWLEKPADQQPKLKPTDTM